MPSLDPLGAVEGGAQLALGIGEEVSSLIKTPKLLRQLKAYQTPKEASQILQATQAAAQQGYDAFSLNYLTSGINGAAAASLGTAERLGADPNQLSAILGQRIQGIMKVGADNHELNMQNFSRYLGALDMVAKDKEAEQISQQDLIKDKIQGQAANKAAGMQNIGSALNSFLSLHADSEISGLYADKTANATTNKTLGGYVGMAGSSLIP